VTDKLKTQKYNIVERIKAMLWHIKKNGWWKLLHVQTGWTNRAIDELQCII